MNTNTTPTSGAADLPEARMFTKKPVTISATQWFKNGDHPQARAIAPSDDLFFTGMGGAMLTGREKYGVIGTLESPNHLVTPGDWIITGVAGEHYACKPDIFEATYSPAALAAGQATAAQQGAAYAEMPYQWREKVAELADQLEKCGVAWIRTNGGTTYNVGRNDGAKFAASELRKVLADETEHVALRASHGQAPAETGNAVSARADSVQEDAARYRWLREGNNVQHGAAWHVAVNLYGFEWDAAIDAAMNKGATQ